MELFYPLIMVPAFSVALFARLKGGTLLRTRRQALRALAALLLAVSLFDIQFAPTAFTDSTMVALTYATGLAALRGHYLGAGLAMGLAVMTN